MSDKTDAKYLLEKYNMTAWENNFCSSLAEQKYELTARQESKLEELLQKYGC